MRKVSLGSVGFSALLLIFSLTIILGSFTYRPEVRLVPLVTGAATAFVGIVVLIGEVCPRSLSAFDSSLPDFDITGGKRGMEQKGTDEAKRLAPIYMSMIGFFLLIFFFGYLIGIGVFLFLFLKVYGRLSWIKSVVVSLITLAFAYGVFEVLARIDLFGGVLFGEILPPL